MNSPTMTLSKLTAIGIALFIIAGCKDRTTAAPPEASAPTSTSSTVGGAWDSTKATARDAAATVRDAVGEAWEKSKAATFNQREAVRERMTAAEAALDAKIVEWGAKKDAVVKEAKPAVDAALAEVEEARAVLSEKIDALDNATEATWNSVKAELDSAWQRMTAAAGNLTAKLQEG